MPDNFYSVTGKEWALKAIQERKIDKLVQELDISDFLARIVCSRNLDLVDSDIAEKWLEPRLKSELPSPFILKDMSRAVKRIIDAFKYNQKIAIFGDYDVDGATSSALLYRTFQMFGVEAIIYIPDRIKEGYGPNISALDKLKNQGVDLLITVDCGTTSFEPINLANEQNVDVVVLDHHQSDIKLPKALALVNPNRLDETSDLKYLCAAGVCFMYLVALNKKLRDLEWFKKNNIQEPNILNFLDLASLGTVCDVVPLIGLNRAIVKQGLKIIKKRSNLGIKTLYDLCKIDSQPTTYDLGFALGPRINAGGRVGKSSHGVELLISEDPKKAYEIATALNKSNLERQSIEMMLYEQIDLEVKKFHNHPVLVMSGNHWHEGVIGIIASKIKDKYNKPTILISVNQKKGKGSARSIVGFDIGCQIIKAVQSNILEKGGGHKMAGGFTINEDKIPIFRFGNCTHCIK